MKKQRQDLILGRPYVYYHPKLDLICIVGKVPNRRRDCKWHKFGYIYDMGNQALDSFLNPESMVLYSRSEHHFYHGGMVYIGEL